MRLAKTNCRTVRHGYTADLRWQKGKKQKKRGNRMKQDARLYETHISDARWMAYDIPGNIGWIAYLVCLAKNLRRGRLLPKHRLLRGFGALTLGGIGGIFVSAFGLAARKRKKSAAVMLAGSVLCAVFAGLCWRGYKRI